MFVLLLSTPMLLLSLIWEKFNYRSKAMLSVLCCIMFSLLFSAYYLNGVDWSIYYLKILYENNPYISFEPGFVLSFKAMLFIFNNNFGLVILVWYFICFGLLSRVLAAYQVNKPLFWCCLLLLFGYNLILEQLRQFLACIIVFYAVLNYNEDHNFRKFIMLSILGSLFHVSSLIIIPAVMLASIREHGKFMISTLFFIGGAVAFMFLGTAIINELSGFNLIFRKISIYMEMHPISLTIGWLNIIDLVFIVIYFCYRKTIDRHENIRLLTRLVFLGAVVHFFSGSITFLARVSFIFFFLAIYVFCIISPTSHRRMFAIRTYNTLFLSIFVFFMLAINLSSYFRNAQAPINFTTMDLRFISLFDKGYVESLAHEKFSKTLEATY
ncbi:polymerase [Enterobacter sp. Ap-916]|uniref:EpsG family protein n=1 Tax=Enterobacteriaceae TaxID=543 RepID=UPI0002729DAB|nr:MULTISPECIES: EpsG family protein [unclassified Enterobacter]EJF32308.1 O-antigen polymerase Wzy [Enterobacter sp. Ag1]NIF57287.1 polymerase [Enterobacter sp. Ap-867]NIG28772.1 polymerase [Enterobacter sp. Ap-916]